MLGDEVARETEDIGRVEAHNRLVRQPVTVIAAQEIVLGHARSTGTERVSILECLGRVLAETVVSPWDIPPLDNSAMDGFAVRRAELVHASPECPVSLEVIEELPAGRIAARAVGPGTAIRIMTGAPIPAGADAVVRMEDTHVEGTRVLVQVAVHPGEHIRRSGEDVRHGEVTLESGCLLTPAAIGMLASLGRAFVQVTQRPRVAVLATGDELVDIGGDRRDGKIIASNLYGLAAQVRECGAIPEVLGIASDTREAIEAGLRQAMACDVILTSGGVSLGDRDLVNEVLHHLGHEMHFWHVAMKPGRPLAFGLLGRSPVFGLPGNPVACMISFEQFVRPALLRMMGHRRLFRSSVQARLQETVHQQPGRTTFTRAVVTRAQDGLVVTTTGTQSSGVLRSMVQANGLLVFPADQAELPAGSSVEVQIIDPGFWMVPESFTTAVGSV